MKRKLCVNLSWIMFVMVMVCLVQLNPSVVAAADNAKLEIGKPLKPFTMQDVNGNTVTLPEPGKINVITVGSIYCGICNAQVTPLKAIIREYLSQHKEVVLYSIDAQNEEASVKNHVVKEDIKYPVLLDKKRIMIIEYKIPAYPTMFVTDANGIIRNIQIRQTSKEDIQKTINDVVTKWPSKVTCDEKTGTCTIATVDVQTDKPSYKVGEPITVNFKDFSTSQYNVITIALKTAPVNMFDQSFYTKGLTAGSAKFTAVSAGEYEVRVLYNDAGNGDYKIQAKADFKIGQTI